MRKQSATETASAKALLALHRLPLDSASLNSGLVLAGILHHQNYLSSTGSGEVKSFLAFTETGLAYGENEANGFHEVKTDARFFSARFPEAYQLAINALHAHAQQAFNEAA